MMETIDFKESYRCLGDSIAALLAAALLVALTIVEDAP